MTVSAKNGQIAFHKPVVYQEKDGQREPVEGRFTLLAKNTVGFALGNYDHSRELVIDPVLAYSTYFGVESGGYPNAIAVDAEGNAYLAGTTFYGAFPITGGTFQAVTPEPIPVTEGQVVNYVTKLNPTGSLPVYSTYLGSPGPNLYYPNAAAADLGIAVDHLGNAYVAGETQAADFPVTSGAYQTTLPSPNGSAFVTKLNPTGTALVYSTFLGGASIAEATHIALDATEHAYVSGYAGPDFPVTAHAFQRVIFAGSGGTAFVTKLNKAGSALIYSTYLGPTSPRSADNVGASALAVDSSGSAYVACNDTLFGSPSSFPVTPGAFQSKPPEGNVTQSPCIVKFNPDGSGLDYATFLHGEVEDYVSGIAVDSKGYAYVTGDTLSLKFPVTSDAFQKTNYAAIANYTYTAFVTKLNLTGTGLAYSTYLGGSGAFGDSDFYPPEGDSGDGIAVNSFGDVYVTGATYSSDFPVTRDALRSSFSPYGESSDGFLTKLNPSGSGLEYSTYLGNPDSYTPLIGYGGSYPTSLALDLLGNAYVAGMTATTNFPITKSAFQSNNTPLYDNVAVQWAGCGFVSKFAFHGGTITTLTASAEEQAVGQSVTLDAAVKAAEGSIVPAGTVDFVVNDIIQAKVPLDDAGHASFTTSDFVLGRNKVGYLRWRSERVLGEQRRLDRSDLRRQNGDADLLAFGRGLRLGVGNDGDDH